MGNRQLQKFIFASKISGQAEAFISMGTLCHNGLARNAIAPTPKRTLIVNFTKQTNIVNIVSIFLVGINVSL